MINKIKNIKPKVEELLKTFPECRDDDNRLYLKLCSWIDPVLRHPNTSFKYFGTQLLNGTLPILESVTRARRKLQEENPELRGESYKVRKVLAEEVKQEINR
jgi:hypothetical protein